jgi:hypothetical protein
MNALTRPAILLRIEAFAVLIAGCIAYRRLCPGHWGLFALLFLAPDIGLLGYLKGETRAAAAFYNALHSYVGPIALAPLDWRISLIWICHIAFDRLLGYGLKYPGSFRHTHLQQTREFNSRPPAAQ